MAKYSYPAVFTPDSGGYSVTFPDWEGATCGDSPEDAVMMAEDFLNLACYDAECRHREFRKPTPVRFEMQRTVFRRQDLTENKHLRVATSVMRNSC